MPSQLLIRTDDLRGAEVAEHLRAHMADLALH
jgi:hypothetical protein